MLEIANVAAGYGTFQALFGVSLEVRAGEAVAVIGPNGAGKTTLLRVISKLIGITSGEVRLEGASLGPVPAHRIIDLGVAHVPEHRRLFPRLTVEDNLRIGAFTPAARARFAERLAYVFELFPRLAERRGQMAGTLSGGEQQMCALGRGLMGLPRVLMLDEPSLGLAPVIVETIFEIVRRIRDDGVTVLMVEQNVRHALALSDRAWVLEHGRIDIEGAGPELLGDELVRKAYLGL